MNKATKLIVNEELAFIIVGESAAPFSPEYLEDSQENKKIAKKVSRLFTVGLYDELNRGDIGDIPHLMGTTVYEIMLFGLYDSIEEFTF